MIIKKYELKYHVDNENGKSWYCKEFGYRANCDGKENFLASLRLLQDGIGDLIEEVEND